MIRLVVTAAFALLFTAVTMRLVPGGFDASLIAAFLLTLLLWWQVLRQLRRGVGLFQPASGVPSLHARSSAELYAASRRRRSVRPFFRMCELTNPPVWL